MASSSTPETQTLAPPTKEWRTPKRWPRSPRPSWGRDRKRFSSPRPASSGCSFQWTTFGRALRRVDLGQDGGPQAAQAIMTTDLRPKERAVRLVIGGHSVTIGGMAKGSGMIHPNMATMLAFITTDAAVDPAFLQLALREATADLVQYDLGRRRHEHQRHPGRACERRGRQPDDHGGHRRGGSVPGRVERRGDRPREGNRPRRRRRDEVDRNARGRGPQPSRMPEARRARSYRRAFSRPRCTAPIPTGAESSARWATAERTWTTFEPTFALATCT